MCRESGIDAYNSLGGTVESMTMVAAELGVSALEGRVSGSLRLLDTVVAEKELGQHFGLIRSGIHHFPILRIFKWW